MVKRVQESDVRHDAMAANDTWKVLDRRKELYFLPEGNDFVVLLARLITISFDLLRPGDHQAEVSRFRELRKFGRFRRRQDLCFQAKRVEMFGRQLADCGIYRSHEFCVNTHFLEHARMLAAYRTVYYCGICSLGYRSRRPDCHGAVDDRQRWPEKLDITSGLTDKIFDVERVADMQNIDLSDVSGRRRDIHSHGIVMLGDEFEERPAHFS